MQVVMGWSAPVGAWGRAMGTVPCPGDTPPPPCSLRGPEQDHVPGQYTGKEAGKEGTLYLFPICNICMYGDGVWVG